MDFDRNRDNRRPLSIADCIQHIAASKAVTTLELGVVRLWYVHTTLRAHVELTLTRALLHTSTPCEVAHKLRVERDLLIVIR